VLEEIREAVLDGNAAAVPVAVERALAQGADPSTILDEALIPALDVVGSEYESGIRYVPEMLASAEAMKAGMSILQPSLVAAGVQAKGRVVLGTVTGDLHDIGKNLVGMMLEGAGYEVVDLGVEVSAERFVEAVREHTPDILALSALLTTTMTNMPAVIKALEKAGLRNTTRVVVGGAPVTQRFAEQIGADGYAVDAPSAVSLVRHLASE